MEVIARASEVITRASEVTTRASEVITRASEVITRASEVITRASEVITPPRTHAAAKLDRTGAPVLIASTTVEYLCTPSHSCGGQT